MKINNLYQFVRESKEKKGRKLKIICDWDEVLMPRNPTVYYIIANRPCPFAEFFQKFWEGVLVNYQGLSCKVLRTNIKEVEKLREEDSGELQNKEKEISKIYHNLYDESPWLSVAQDLLRALEEDLIEYFIITGNYKKDRHKEIAVDETLGGDLRKIKKFRKSFAKFPNTKLKINAPFYTDQGEIKSNLLRSEWIKKNHPDFDIFIDDNPNNISETRELFLSNSEKIYVLPDYETNKYVQGENILRVAVQPTLLKDEDFVYQVKEEHQFQQTVPKIIVEK